MKIDIYETSAPDRRTQANFGVTPQPILVQVTHHDNGSVDVDCYGTRTDGSQVRTHTAEHTAEEWQLIAPALTTGRLLREWEIQE